MTADRLAPLLDDALRPYLELLRSPDDQNGKIIRGVAARLAAAGVTQPGDQRVGPAGDRTAHRLPVQRQSEANAEFTGTRSPMGTRDWRSIPTSGVPAATPDAQPAEEEGR